MYDPSQLSGVNSSAGGLTGLGLLYCADYLCGLLV